MDEEKKFDQNKYVTEYTRQYIKQVRVSLNKSKEEDMKLLDWINSQPEGASGYLKRLAKEDMDKAGK